MPQRDAAEAMLVAWAADSGLLAAGLDPPWLSLAPAGTALPYSTYTHINRDIESSTGEDPVEVEADQFQVTVVAGSAADAKALAKLVKSAFHKRPLPMDDTGTRHCHTLLASSIGPYRDPEPIAGVGGIDVHAVALTFVVMSNAEPQS